MATKTSSYNQTESNDRLDRISLGNVSHTLEGGGVCWDIDSVTLAHAATIVVRNYDESRYGEYGYGFNTPDRKPHIIIKVPRNRHFRFFRS